MTKLRWPMIVAAAVLLLFLTNPIIQAKSASSTSRYDQGWQAYDSGHYARAFEIWQALAEQGHELAQVNLGAMYDAGQGTAENPTKAFELFLAAAQKGNPYAQYNVANMYAQGRGIRCDRGKAKSWYLKAAEQDLAIAQYGLGMLNASDVAENDTDATQHLDIAIGWLYKSGLTHLKNDNLSGARQAYDSIAELAGDHPLAEQLSCKIESKKHFQGADSRIASFVGASFGTGWPISAGYVITNHHVVDSAAEILLLDVSGQQIKARPILSDAVHDIAILQVVDTALLPPAIPLATNGIDVGARVFTMGFPRIDQMGVTPKLTDGVISKLSGLQNDPASYQTTVPIQPGNSGGPLLNMSGEVVGVVRSMIGVKHMHSGETRVYENASCATKIDRLSKILSKLQPPADSLQTLPHEPENMAALKKRLQNSLLIVVAR
ncbi:MAG: tetratricopeptide repeat-containing serine protease family protein [Desulfobacterales bacterium]|jgi:S1-C subfamily serine protease